MRWSSLIYIYIYTHKKMFRLVCDLSLHLNCAVQGGEFDPTSQLEAAAACTLKHQLNPTIATASASTQWHLHEVQLPAPTRVVQV